MRLVAALVVATCIAIVRPMQAQSAADSAAVLSLVVDAVLGADSAVAPRGRDQSAPSVPSAEWPRVFVRIGTVPQGAWAEPSIARLRAHHWFFNGWAMDSTRAFAERNKPRPTTASPLPFPAVLSLRLTFAGDSARVDSSFDMDTCEQHGGMKGILTTTYFLVRDGSSWRMSDSVGGIADVLCTSSLLTPTAHVQS
jgi:hypothetical protein